ncbi:hypothetical protein [Georgenia sp. Marseille-Q6866]
MSTSPASAPALAPAAVAPAFRSSRAPDRFMRRLLRVSGVNRESGRGAHRAFRVSVVVSGVRCLITYLLVPVLVPVLSLAGWVAAPIGLALCVVAVVNGVIAVRRFWVSDHRSRWMYTAFMGVVFAILAIAATTEIQRWEVMA